MLCLLLLMLFSVLVGISFQKSTKQELDRLRRSLASGFILEANARNEMYREYIEYESGFGGYEYTGPKITEEMIQKIVSLDGVKGYIVNRWGNVWVNLELRPGLYASMEPDPHPELERIPTTEERLMLDRHRAPVYFFTSDGALHKNFRSGAFTICEGRNIKKKDHCKIVISDWLAERNHLSVGDVIPLEVKEGTYTIGRGEYMKTWGEPIETEIVGLFHTSISLPDSDSTLECSYTENLIYTDMGTYAKICENLKRAGHEEFIRDDAYVTVEFVTEDPGQIEFIMERIKTMEGINLENISVTTDNTGYQAAAKPYHQIRFFYSSFCIGTVRYFRCQRDTVLYKYKLFWHSWYSMLKHEEENCV